ncbi:MAG: radical SAM protein [Endomicrobiales bacterium]
MNTSLPSEQRAYRRLNRDLFSLFRNVIAGNIFSPLRLFFLVKALINQRGAARRRASWERKGVHVPAFMIVSVTTACNLQCRGCYSSALRPEDKGAMDPATLKKILSEARETGIGIVLISGGEPLSYPGLLDLLKDFPEIIFVLFTNGLRIDAGTVAALKKHRHVIPVVSLEGDEKETDERRGSGVFDRVAGVFRELKKNKVLSGVSLTVTRQNFGTIFDPDFVRRAVEWGSGLVFFVEYIPADESTEDAVPGDEQRARVPELIRDFRSRFPALFFAFPFEEEYYGGCLASGRGFIHINAAGDVEPCPFAPYSDSNIRTVPLREALQSRILRVIRENHGRLQETRGGCALWKNREWLRSLKNDTP